MNKLRGGMAVAAFALSARSSGSLSVPSPVIRQGRALSESLLGIRLNMSRWQIFRTLFLSAMSVLVVGFATMTYHMPLMQKISEFHNRMPAAPTPLKFKPGFKRELENEELVKIEQQALEWHDRLWAFRTEIISSIALVNMDDEEDFELEGIKENSDGTSRNEMCPWLTFHLIAHVLLIIIAHVYDSHIFSLTALYSQILFLVLFLRAKFLGDAVSSTVSVVRKFARNMGTHVSVSSSERTLLQFQMLQNKMDFLTDLHESHQLGMGFFLPFVGTLKVDLNTLVMSFGLNLLELVILMATRYHNYKVRRQQEEDSRKVQADRKRLGIKTDESIMRDDVNYLRSQVDTLQSQVKGKLDELELLMITSHSTRPPIGVPISMTSSLASPPQSSGGVPTNDCHASPLERTFRNFLRCKSLDCDSDAAVEGLHLANSSPSSSRTTSPAMEPFVGGVSELASLTPHTSASCPHPTPHPTRPLSPHGLPHGVGRGVTWVGLGQTVARCLTPSPRIPTCLTPSAGIPTCLMPSPLLMPASAMSSALAAGAPPSDARLVSADDGIYADDTARHHTCALHPQNVKQHMEHAHHPTSTTHQNGAHNLEATCSSRRGVQGGSTQGTQGLELDSLTPTGKVRMSMRFSQLLGGSSSGVPAAVVANISSLPAGIAANIANIANAASSARRGVASADAVAGCSQDGCSWPSQDPDAARSIQSQASSRTSHEEERTSSMASALIRSVVFSASASSDETWSWGGIRQRVKGKSSEAKACAAKLSSGKLSNSKVSSGASRDKGKGSGRELSPSVESSYFHSPTVEHALPQLSHDAPQPLVSGVPAKGRVAGSSSASGWWGGVSVTGSKGLGSKVGADTAKMHCEKAKVYGGGCMPPGFVFENGQLRVKVGQDDDGCGADCVQKVTCLWRETSETSDAHTEAHTCLWHATSETSQSSVSNVHTESSEPNPQSTAAKHTRKESIDFQDCVDGGGGHGLVDSVVDDGVVDGGVVDDGVVESPASPCLTDMSDMGDAQDAMRHHSLRWHEEQTPGALTAASQSGCWDMAQVKKPCNMPPQAQVQLKCIMASQPQAMPPAPHVCRSSASRPAARVASTDSIETMFTHIKNHHLARMSAKDQDALKHVQGVTVEVAKGGNRDAHYPLLTPPLTPSFHDSFHSFHAGVSVSEDGGASSASHGGASSASQHAPSVSEDGGASNSSASMASALSASEHTRPLSASEHAPPFKGAHITPGSNVQAAKEAEAVQVVGAVGGSSSKALNKTHSELRIERLFQAFEEQPCQETGAHWSS